MIGTFSKFGEFGEVGEKRRRGEILIVLALVGCGDDGGRMTASETGDTGVTVGPAGDPTVVPSTGEPTSTSGEATETSAVTTSGPDAPLSVAFAAPGEGAAVAGLVMVDLLVSGADSVELKVDDVLVGSDDAAPWGVAWDTATAHANDLPAATHAFDFGYYFVDGRYGDFRAEVAGYTNLYYAWAWRGYPTDLPWGPPFAVSLANAAAEGRDIHLNLQEPGYYDEALDLAAPHWDSVRRIEAADEPPWTQGETEAILADLRAKLDARGLPHLPIGIVYTRDQVLYEDGIYAAGLDWVGIEAYVDPPGDADPAVNAAGLTAYVEEAKARVPADKNLVIVMQAYDRNGAWPDIATLTALQEVGYGLAYADPRVLALTMFSYGRPGGTHDHLELAAPHKRMGERILGVTVPSLSNGPHTLVAIARRDGETVMASRAVTVVNP